MIRSNLVSDFRGVAFKPIEFKMEGLKRSVSIPDVLSFEIEGVASRNRSGEPFYIDNTAHPAGRRLALARAGQTACARVRARPRHGRQGQQRPLRAICLGGVGRAREAGTVAASAARARRRSAGACRRDGDRLAVSVHRPSGHGHVDGAERYADMPDMAMPFAAPWVFAMWWVMMLGMMLPSAAPMILTFAALQRRKRERDQPYVPTAMFVAGYLVVWGVFSLAATAAQWALQQGALLSPMLALTSPLAGGVLFILAGIYQFTPLKNACLRQCRSPFAFVLEPLARRVMARCAWAPSHGLYCLGCCWVLMALLFAVGVMNLIWVAAIAALVFVEKLLRGGVWVGRAGGGAMAVFGVWLMVQ